MTDKKPSVAALARQIRSLEKEVAGMKDKLRDVSNALDAMVVAYENDASATNYWALVLAKDTQVKVREWLS